jgi:hypothetical protein
VALRIDELRERIAEWAAQRHRDELIAGIELYLGDHPREQERAMAGVAFALVAPPEDGDSLIERYAAEMGRRPRAERVLLEQWSRTWFSLLRVTSVQLDQWVEVHDVLREVHLRIYERSATRSLGGGEWLAAFYFLDPSQRWALEGTAAVVVPQARIHAVKAALAAMKAGGVDGATMSPAASRRLARPVMAAIHQGSRQPRLINADRHDILMVTSTLGLTWERLLEGVGRWSDAEVHEDHVTVFGSQPATFLEGRASRAAFHLDDDGTVTLFTNSRERHDMVLERWQAETGVALPVREEQVQQAPSDPDGPEVIVDSAVVDVAPGEDPQRAGEAAMARQGVLWLDQPVPALDGLSPRQAAAQGRRAEVWALLGAGQGLSVDEPAAELGLT